MDSEASGVIDTVANFATRPASNIFDLLQVIFIVGIVAAFLVFYLLNKQGFFTNIERVKKEKVKNNDYDGEERREAASVNNLKFNHIEGSIKDLKTTLTDHTISDAENFKELNKAINDIKESVAKGMHKINETLLDKLT